MSDQTPGPRPSVRPSGLAPHAGAETRTRPARPIRFTPSRTEPIHLPAPQQAPAATPSLAARLLVWVSLVLGWSVFAAWWAIVLRRESIRSFGVALGIIAATLAASAVATWAWTRHNIRIAKRGNRGRSSLYIPMHWERDTLGRTLALPAPDQVRTAAEVRIELRGSTKAYVVADGEEL